MLLERSFSSKSRQIHDLELNGVEAFLRRLHTWTSGRDLENKMVWLNLQCGILPIKFLYSSLFNGQIETFPYKIV